jgi:hypothetical protein
VGGFLLGLDEGGGLVEGADSAISRLLVGFYLIIKKKKKKFFSFTNQRTEEKKYNIYN